MTVPAGNSRNEYDATGGQTVFTYTFPIYDESEIKVYQTAVGVQCSESDLLTLTTHYTVTGVGAPAGGTIVLVSGATLDDAMSLASNIPSARTVDYQSNGSFTPTAVNADLDTIMSLLKQALTGLGRALRFGDCEQAVDATLPSREVGKAFGWGASGDIVNIDLTVVTSDGPDPDLTDVDNAFNVSTTGDPENEDHIAFGPTIIQAKSDDTTASVIKINTLGGNVEIGDQSGMGISIVNNTTMIVKHGGTNVVSSTTAALGGLLVNNLATGAGSERVLTTSDGVQTAQTTSNQTVNSSTSLVPIVGLDNVFTIVAGIEYTFEAWLPFEQTGGAGLRVELNIVNPDRLWAESWYANSSSAIALTTFYDTDVIAVNVASGSLQTRGAYHFKGSIFGSSGGLVSMDFTQNTSVAGDSTIIKGAYLKLTRV